MNTKNTYLQSNYHALNRYYKKVAYKETVCKIILIPYRRDIKAPYGDTT